MEKGDRGGDVGRTGAEADGNGAGADMGRAGGRTWGAAVAVAALVGAVASGCGGSSGSAASGSDGGASTTSTTARAEVSVPDPSSTTTERAAAPTTTTSAPAEDQTVEEAVAGALIAAPDLGSGWTRQVVADTPLTSTNTMLLAVPACHDLLPDAGDGADAEATAKAEYTTTTAGSALDVQYQVDRYAEPADAAAVVELVGNPEFGTCLATALTSMAGEVTIDAVSLSPQPIPTASELGIDEAAAIAATITLTSDGQKATVLAQVVVLRQGGALGTFTVTSTSTSGVPRATNIDATTLQAAATKLQAIAVVPDA